mmetsp:Transcript_28025/g.24759  ORF Transcript_28025/g.24759 Transcript_28025/m.24759 type:complete len:84 (-) Transcript_28025:248-499(-)
MSHMLPTSNAMSAPPTHALLLAGFRRRHGMIPLSNIRSLIPLDRAPPGIQMSVSLKQDFLHQVKSPQASYLSISVHIKGILAS